jgi:hypothetical protein
MTASAICVLVGSGFLVRGFLVRRKGRNQTTNEKATAVPKATDGKLLDVHHRRRGDSLALQAAPADFASSSASASHHHPLTWVEDAVGGAAGVWRVRQGLRSRTEVILDDRELPLVVPQYGTLNIPASPAPTPGAIYTLCGDDGTYDGGAHTPSSPLSHRRCLWQECAHYLKRQVFP